MRPYPSSGRRAKDHLGAGSRERLVAEGVLAFCGALFIQKSKSKWKLLFFQLQAEGTELAQYDKEGGKQKGKAILMSHCHAITITADPCAPAPHAPSIRHARRQLRPGECRCVLELELVGEEGKKAPPPLLLKAGAPRRRPTSLRPPADHRRATRRDPGGCAAVALEPAERG